MIPLLMHPLKLHDILNDPSLSNSDIPSEPRYCVIIIDTMAILQGMRIAQKTFPQSCSRTYVMIS